MLLLVLVLAVLLAIWAAGCGDGSSAPRATPEARSDAPARRSRPPRRSQPRVAWTHAAVLRRIDGRRIRVADRTVRIDRGTVACGGVGRPAARRRGEPAWTRFRCVQPTFPPGSVAGPDAIFVVEPTGRRTLRVTGARLTRY